MTTNTNDAPQPDPNLPFPQTIGEPEPSAPAPEPTAEEQRIAALEAQLAQQSQQTQQLLQAMTSYVRPTQPAQPAQPAAPPEFSLDGLPDPVSAPKDFMAQLQARIREREQQQAQYLTSNITSQVARAAAVDGLYNRFASQHSELAKRSALLRGTADMVFRELQSQGIDPVAVAMQNPDSLVATLAARMQAELGTAAAPAPGGQPQHGMPFLPGAAPTPSARTQGIAGGSAGPARPPAAPAAPKSFLQQLNETRQRDGLI